VRYAAVAIGGLPEWPRFPSGPSFSSDASARFRRSLTRAARRRRRAFRFYVVTSRDGDGDLISVGLRFRGDLEAELADPDLRALVADAVREGIDGVIEREAESRDGDG
jgi:hypothetical protein